MILIYLITKNEKDATSISRKLMKERLANSINIIPSVKTIKWTGKGVSNMTDTVVLIKTKALLYSRIEALVCKLMKSKDPALFSVPITQINHKYQDRLRQDIQAV